VDRIPADVSAMILPKTLFGERYVALSIPRHATGGHLSEGDVIPLDRSSAAIETQKVLNDLVPVLKAVKPAKLSATLSAISHALSGRGKNLGETLVHIDSYLRRLDPSLPDLNADLAALGDVADSYAAAAPDLLSAMSRFTTTSRTLLEQRRQLRDLYATVTTTSADLRNFLAVNEKNIIALNVSAKPVLGVLARYAPEYPCLFRQFAAQVGPENRVFGKGTDHPHAGSFTETITVSRGKYVPGRDDPRYLDNRGPRCYEAQDGKLFPQYPPDGPLKDGSYHPPAPTGRGSGAAVPGFAGALLSWPSQTGSVGGAPATTSHDAQGAAPGAHAADPAGAQPQIANSPSERTLLATLLAPTLRVMPKDVPGWSSLLAGPLYRGSEVTLK
jgi:virulence factor Mce-like protein